MINMSIWYKIFKWKPWTILTNYDIDSKCLKCPKCGSTSFEETLLDTVSNVPSEIDTHCMECKEHVNYWAYGAYDPIFRLSDRSFEMWSIRRFAQK